MGLADTADEQLWRGLEWQKVEKATSCFFSSHSKQKTCCLMDTIEGSHDLLQDGSIAAGRGWVRRRGTLRVACSGITRVSKKVAFLFLLMFAQIRVISRCEGEGAYKLTARSGDTNVVFVERRAPGEMAVELTVLEQGEVDVEIEDQARLQ